MLQARRLYNTADPAASSWFVLTFGANRGGDEGCAVPLGSIVALRGCAPRLPQGSVCWVRQRGLEIHL